MELLGKNLETHFNDCQRRFSIKTISLIAVSLIQRLKHIHDKNMIHRDLKPENFMTGIDNNIGTIYLIDFGLCSKYRSTKTNEHINLTTGHKIVGTARYASINSHKGYGKLYVFLIYIEQRNQEEMI